MPLLSAGLDSISATELTRALGLRLSRELPATLIFDHPTIADLTAFVVSSSKPQLRDSDSDDALGQNDDKLPTNAPQTRNEERDCAKNFIPTCSSASIELPGMFASESALQELVIRAHVASTRVPIARWHDKASMQTSVGASATYGAFSRHALRFDVSAFGISPAESRSMDAVMAMALEGGYAAYSRSLRVHGNTLVNNQVGVFVGAGGITGCDGTGHPRGELTPTRRTSVYTGTSTALDRVRSVVLRTWADGSLSLVGHGMLIVARRGACSAGISSRK